MAGLRLTSSTGWIVASWVFELLVERLDEELPPSSMAKRMIETGRRETGNFVDFETVPDLEKKEIARAVEKIRQEFEKAGSAAFSTPEFFPGFLERLGELQTLIGIAWLGAEPSVSKKSAKTQGERLLE